jgi:hypothetical protein
MMYVLKDEERTNETQLVSSVMKGKDTMKKHIWQVLAVLFTITVLNIFSSFPAHASTQMVHGRNIVTHVSSVRISDCVKVTESDTGWGETFSTIGPRLNLNNVSFGAVNNCNVDATIVFWKVVNRYTCAKPITHVVRSGIYHNLASQNFDQFFRGSDLLMCAVEENGQIVATYVPRSPSVTFVVQANLSGGTSSSYAFTRSYP